jgi:PKD repeat protein
VACPAAQTKTIVACDDDSTPGQVYIYVGTKLATGTEVQKAGLTNGSLYGVIANGQTTESQATGIGLAKGVGGPFTLAVLPDQSLNSASYSTSTETDATAAGVTKFNRPEDGCWDPLHPADYYFVTTDAPLPNGRSRLWRLRFTDIANPQNGGTITMMLDGTEGGDMFDNITIDRAGHVVLCEDLGTNAKSGKVWQFDIATSTFTILMRHDVARFGDTGTPATAPFNTDEESSGVIDAEDILGPGWFLIDVQAHYNPGDAELVEGGQLLAFWNPDSVTPPAITAAASASTTSASVGENVAFQVAASSPGDGALTYSWNFGDGSPAGVGSSVSHAYSAPGSYPAVVTVTHTASGKTATSQISVNVARPMGALSLTVALNFAKAGKDTLTLTGEVPIGTSFDPSGKQVSIDVGGIRKTFTLGANGASPASTTESFKLAVRKFKGAVAAQRAKFTMTLRNSDLAGQLADEKLTSRTVANDPVAVNVSVTFDGRPNSETLDLIYNAVLGKKGTAK